MTPVPAGAARSTRSVAGAEARTVKGGEGRDHRHQWTTLVKGPPFSWRMTSGFTPRAPATATKPISCSRGRSFAATRPTASSAQRQGVGRDLLPRRNHPTSIAHPALLAAEYPKLFSRLRQQTRELGGANDDLVRPDQVRSRLVCNFSYELKTLLPLALGCVDLILNLGDPIETRETL